MKNKLSAYAATHAASTLRFLLEELALKKSKTLVSFDSASTRGAIHLAGQLAAYEWVATFLIECGNNSDSE